MISSGQLCTHKQGNIRYSSLKIVVQRTTVIAYGALFLCSIFVFLTRLVGCVTYIRDLCTGWIDG